MSVVGVFFSILSMGVPIIFNLIFNVFKAPVTFSDVFVSFLIHMTSSIMGALIGLLLQPRMIENRKMAMLGAIFIVVMTIAKVEVLKEF